MWTEHIVALEYKIWSVNCFENDQGVESVTRYTYIFSVVLYKFCWLWNCLCFLTGQYKVTGTVAQAAGQAFSTDLKVTYGKQHVTLKSDLKRPSPSEIHVNILLYPSQYPDVGISLIWDYKRDKNNVSVNMVYANSVKMKRSLICYLFCGRLWCIEYFK